MSFSLRPALRPSTLPSLPTAQKSATYICTPCRHARLLRRPKRPYTFTQLVTLSDGSAFMLRTTSPQPVYRSTRDTRNAPLWNPSSKELTNVEDDEAGRLAGFRARFGTQFDAVRESDGDAPKPTPNDMEVRDDGQLQTTVQQQNKDLQMQQQDDEWQYEFEEDDANLLDLISSYGQSGSSQSSGSATQDAAETAKSKQGKK